jgi:hypothetical protein
MLTADLVLARCETLESGSLRRTITDAALAFKRGGYSSGVTVADVVRRATSRLTLTVIGETIVDGVLRTD